MKSWHTVFLLAVTLALGGWILVHERSLPSSREILESRKVLTEFTPEQVTFLDGVAPGGSFRIERQWKNWMLTEPLTDLVDPDRMTAVVEALATLPVVDQIDRERLVEIGLSEEELGFSRETAIAIQVHLDDGQSVRLQLGAAGPFSHTTYFRTPGTGPEGTVYLAGVDLRSAFSDPVESLRDRRLVRLEPGNVSSWTMRTASGSVQLNRDEYFEDRWMLSAPLQTRANDDIAYSILEEILNLEITTFPDISPDLPLQAELDEKTAIFELLPNGSDEPVQLVLQEEVPAEPGKPVTMLARTSHRPHAFRVTNNLVSRLPTSVNQLRYPWLTDVDPRLVAAITIESPEDPDVMLRSDGKRWALIYHGHAVDANKLRVDRFLRELREEPILEFVSDTGSGLAEFGLERPLVKVTVTTSTMDATVYEDYLKQVEEASASGLGEDAVPLPEGEVEDQVFQFGFGRGNFMYVNVEGEPFVYALDPAFLTSSVETHPLRWRGTRLLGFSQLSLRSLSVQEAGAPAIEMDYDYITGLWTGKVGDRSIDELIDRRQADRKARHLGNLEVSEWLTSRRDAYQALAMPSCVVRIGLERSTGEGDGTTENIEVELKLAPAVLSAEGVAYYYGQITGGPDVFLISADSYNRIAAPVIRAPEP